MHKQLRRELMPEMYRYCAMIVITHLLRPGLSADDNGVAMQNTAFGPENGKNPVPETPSMQLPDAAVSMTTRQDGLR